MIHVSVIIAAYKAVGDLERAVTSVLNQTISNIEVIIVDDCSPDRTFEVAQELSARDARVRAVRMEQNVGPGFARNRGIEIARGKWIAVLDADDAFHPERLERLTALGEAGGAQIVSDNLALRDPDTGEITGVMFPPDWIGNEPHLLDPTTYVLGNIGTVDNGRRAYGFSKPIILHSFIESHNIRYRISRFSEDYIFYIDALIATAQWLITPDAYYIYDVRSGTLSNLVRLEDTQAVVEAERNVLALPAVRADTALKTAISRHLRSVELGLIWMQVAEGLKARNLQKAIAAGTTDFGTIIHVLKEVFSHLRRAMTTRISQR